MAHEIVPTTPSTIVPVTSRELVAMGPKLTEEFTFPGEKGKYVIYSFDGQPLLETDQLRLAIAKAPSGQVGLVMLSVSPEHNHLVDLQYRLATTIQKVSAQLDAKVSAGERAPHYGAFFPTALEVFETEDDRAGVFLGYHPSIASYTQFKPMSLVLDANRIDIKTGAWILGKALKCVDYLHKMGFALSYVDETNTFLEVDQHGVFFLDLTSANESPSVADTLNDVAKVAKMVYWAIGGSRSENPPHDAHIASEAHHADFVTLIKKLMEGKTSADDAYEEAYPLFDVIWPKKPGGTTGGLKRDWHLWTVYPFVRAESAE